MIPSGLPIQDPTMKLVLLLVLGLSWAMRIAAFKIAAERGVPAGIII